MRILVVCLLVLAGPALAAEADMYSIGADGKFRPTTAANPMPTTTVTGPVSMSAGTVGTVTVGGTAVTAVTGPVNGCYLANPTTAADQGIGSAEALYLDPVNTATTSANVTNAGLAVGQPYTCPGAIPAGRSISVNAVTTGHKFTVVVW